MHFRVRPVVWSLAVAAAAVSCSSDNLTLPNEGLPAAIASVSGTAQTAVVATPLPDSLLVRVTDSKSRPVEGVKVVFTPLLGGGDAVPDTGVTNADGRTGARWILGSTAGAQRVQVMVVGATSSGALTQNFDATALAAPADTVFAVRGNNQSGVIGGALTDSLVVKVTDRFGNAVSGSAVSWAATGGGTVSPPANTTGTTGTAATARVLGATAGPQGATATAGTLKGSPVVFTMTATPAAPASLIKVSGDNQIAAVGTVPAESLVVRLLDGSGNGVPGRNVTFAVATGGGTTSPTSATTDATGRAATAWTLGTVAGPNSLIASSSGFSVTFQATGTAAVPTTLLANSPVSQTDTAGLPAASPPSVKVTDASGNPVAGVSVTFAVAGGGGSILPVTPIATNALGIATLTSWTLGGVVGANAVTATAAGLTGSPLSFTATAVAGTAAQLQIQTQPSSGAQSGVAFAVQPVVRLADVFGNAVSTDGTVIAAALATGTGTLGGTLTATTVAGVATFTNLSINGTAGAFTLGFTSGVLTAATSSTITLGAGTATRLAIVLQPSATAQNAIAFLQQPQIQVQDASNNPVAGVVSITAAIATGGGALGGLATISTNAAGLATFAGLSITGTVGVRTLQFTSGALTPVASGNVSITAGAPTQMAVNAGNSQTATAGSTVLVAPSVVVRDVSSNPVSGVAVTFAVASGGGSVLPLAAVTTNASGIAAATSWTLGPAAGANTLTATAAPAGITANPVTFTATGIPGGAGGLRITTPPSASVVNGAALAQAPVVQVLDVNGNAVATPTSVAITVVIASGPGGALAGLTTVGTNASGLATFAGLSITGLAGSYTLQFTSPTLTPITSSAIVLSAGVATQLFITTQPPANAQSAIAMAPATVVQVQDVSGNLVSGSATTVTAALASGGAALSGTLSTAAVTGVATFGNLILTGTIGPRTIRFTATGLTPDTSTAIALAAGTPTVLEYVQQPTAVTAGQVIAPAVTVRVRDGAGNTITTATNAVTMAIGANPGTSTLSGTLTANAVAGVATFGTLSLNRAGASYTLIASATGLTSVTSAAFAVNSAGATTIAANSVVSQSGTAGLPAAAPPSVLVTDANGNPVAGVAVTFAVTGGGGSIAPVTPVATNAAGIATLTSWTLGNGAGANTVTASGTGLTPALVTFTATGLAGAATQLQMVTQPASSAQSGVVLTIQPVVRLADAFGNLVATNGTTVTAAVSPVTGTLGGTPTAVTVAGVATFAGLSITGPSNAYTLQFTSTGLASVTSTTIGIGAGVATKLVMVTQPSTTAVSGVALAVQPSVQLQDAASNPVATAGIPVTVAITGGLGTLGGTATVNTNAAGLATFAGLSITGVVGARTLVFSSGSLATATSTTITLSAGVATQMSINSTNGQSATVNTAVAAPPSVIVRDVSNNPVAGVSVTFAVASGGGSVLPVTPVVTNASGVAALTSWTMGITAGANSVTATSGTLVGSPVAFTATGSAGAATQLIIQTQPSPAALSGVALAVQPVVRLGDAFGNLVATTGTPVAAAFASGTGTLGGTLTANTVGGVATFTNLAITGVAGAYTLGFSSAGLVPDTSTAITIGAGAASRLVITQQPSPTALNAVAFAQQPTIQLQDAAGNPVAQVGVVVTAAILTGTPALGGTITATTNAGGLATFTNLAITGLVGLRTLQFTSGVLTPVTSGNVSVAAGVATQMSINSANGQFATVNTAVAAPPSVIVRDVSNNPVAGVSVTFAVASGGGIILPVAAGITNASGVAALTSWTLGTLAGANSVTATSGTLVGSPVTFTATGTAGAATQLQMVSQPSPSAQSGVVLAAQPAVRLADAFGNLVTTTGTVVTATIASGTGTLGGTATASTVNGVATFTNLVINGAAGAYTLGFTSGVLTAATSGTITLGAGTAARLAIVVQPSPTAQNAVAFAQQPTIQLQDAAGNPVAQVGVVVTAAILTGTPALGGTITATTNAGGLATFSGLLITGTVGARTLQFTSGVLTPVTSGSVTLAAGAATQIAINGGNAQTATVNTVVTTPPSVIVRDVSSNPVAGVSVTFAVASGGGSILPVAPGITNAAGVVALTSWTLGTVAGANSITATSIGLTGSPMTFTATGTAGLATQLQMVTQPPATAQSGVVLAPQPAVRLADAFGNQVATTGIVVTATLASGTGTVGGTATASTVNGVAAFTNLSVSGAAGAYTLGFAATGVTAITSSSITLGAGTASRLAMVVQPSASAQNAVVLAQQPTVQVQDAAGNPVAGVVSVTATILTGGGTLGGTATISTNAAGLATFTTLAITGTVGARTLSFGSAGLTSVTSASIGLTAGAPTQMSISVGNAQTATAGSAVATAPSVLVRDVSANPVSGVAVTFAVASGGGSVLPATPVTTNAAGIAAATSWTLGTVAGANSLTATAAPAGITPNPITFTATGVAGSAGRLAMVAPQPTTATSGATISPAPVVQLQDALGNPLTTQNFGITASIASGPVGTLGGSLVALTDATGRATFSTLTITGLTGSYTLQFNGPSVTGVTSGAIGLTAGAAARVAVITQPNTTQSGIVFPTAPTVQVQDAAGNPVAVVRSISVVSNSGTALLSGPSPQNTNAAGLATFPNLVLTGTIGPNALLFSSAGLTTDTTAVITLTAGAATQLTMAQPPSASAASGVAFAQQPTVQVRDGSGNSVAGVFSVTAAIASGGGALGGVATVNTNAGGLATFAGLSITGTVGSRTLQFTSGALTAATSTAVSITAGAASQLVMVQQPSATAASGVAFAQQPTVQVRDASGNAVAGVASVTATILTGGGTLGGVATINTSAAGLATFAGLSITGTVGARTLQFTSGVLTPVTSSAVSITAGAPTQMAVSVGDGQSAIAGQAVATPPAVLVRDASSNPVAGVAVTFAVASGGGAALPVAAVLTNASGIATATSWTLGTVAGPNSLTATAAPGGIIPNPVTFTATGTPGAATQLVMVQQPSATAANGVAFVQQPTVQARDALGNAVPGIRSVTVAIFTGGGTLGGTATLNTDAGGLATFAGLSITGTVGARTLQFTSGVLTPASSGSINVTAGTASQVVMVQQPSASAASGAVLAQQPTVQIQDVSGNAVAGVASVTATILTGGGTLGGVATINTSAAGLATFAGLSITGTIGARTLRFTSGVLTPASSTAIGITAGAASQLVMVQQPSPTAQNAIAFVQQPTAQVQDASGNAVAAVVPVTAAILTGGGTLGGTATVSTSAGGLATFTNLAITGTVGARTLQFTSGVLTPVNSGSINLTAGTASQLVMVQQPSASAASGAAFAQQPQVQVQDASGNAVAGVASVTAAIASGGGTLNGIATINTSAAGLATFAGLSITGTVGARTLQFTSGALTPATSAAIGITAGAASQLVMVQQPSITAQNGIAFAQQPTVQVQDAAGNAVAGVASVTAAILTGGGTLGGLATINTSAGGLATFAGLSITGTVGARTLQFTSGVLTPVTSSAVSITAGAPTQMAVSAGDAQSATVGTAVSVAPAVIVRDVSNNPVSGVSVTFAAATGGGSALPVAAVTTNASGIATATSWTLGTVAGANSLTATAAPGGIVPNPVTFTATGTPGAATQLVMVQQPSATVANGAVFAQQPTVQVRDALGNAVPGVVSVTAAIASGGGTLGGVATINTSAGGLATFSGLSITGTVGARTLQFTSGALTPVTSAAVSLTAGAPTQMAVSAGDGQSAVSGSAVAIAPAVLVRDASSNPVAGVSVTFAAATGGGSALPVAAVTTNPSGIATATSWTLGTVAGANSLTATAAPGGIVPNPITFAATGTPGAATALAITTAPTAGQSGIAVTPQPVVRLVDANGNTVPTTGTLVTATLASGTGTLSNATATTTSGVATFAGLAISGTAGNYSFAFNAPSVAGITTGLIPITAGAPTALVFSQQPTTSIAGGNITPTVQVRVVDGAGNLVTTATTSITLTIGTNPVGGILSGTTTQNAASGSASFPGLSINRTGTGYTLLANGGSLIQATSTAFDITPGTAAALAFTVEPSTVVASVAIAPAVQVEVRDALGNRVTGSTAPIAMAIGTNPGSSTLGGTTAVNAVAGVATFGNLSLNRSAAGYTLSASSAGVTTATSSAFTVNPGVATALAITTAPTTGQNGVVLAPQPVVRLVDANGNTVPTNAIVITAALASGSGVLGGTLTANTVSGVATFSGLTLTGTVGAYTLNFSSGALTSVTTGAIALSAGVPAGLAFLVPPSNVASGASISPAVQVRVVDGSGNLVGTATNSVTIGLGSNPVGGALGGTLTASAVAGVATFSTLTLDRAGVGYSLTAASGGLTGATSSPFNVTAGPATRLAFSAQPTTTAAGASITPAVQVEIQDAAGNRVTTATNAITLAPATNPVGGTLTGGGAVAAVAGVATFPALSLNRTGTGYTLGATTAGLTAGTSSAFDITPGAAAALVFTTQPSTVVAGVVMAPAVVVEVRDGSGNRVTTATTPITLGFGVNAGGSTLGGAGPVAAVAGVATFSGLTLNRTGAGYTLTADGGGLPQVISSSFTVTPAAPAVLVFGTQPTGTTVGAAIAPPVTVRIQDALGNLTASTATVALAFGANPGSATLGGTVSLAAVAGVATFSNLTVNAAGVGYTLAASSAGLTGATSSAFTIGRATSTATIVSDLPDPSVTGQPVTVNYTVTSTGGTPTGTVTVSDGTVSCNAAVGTGSCPLTFLTIGPKTITATYPGDANFAGSVSAGVAHTVTQATTTSLLASHTPNPSARGAPVNISWAVAPAAPGTGTLTGTVNITDGVDSCSAAVGAVGCTITLTTVGTRSLTATYSGDANYVGSVSAGVSHTVNPAATTTTITSDNPDPSSVGQQVTVNFTVTSAGGTPTGNVTVSDGTVSCVGTVAVPNCALTFTTAGAKTLTATYAGDVNFAGSASAGAGHTVNAAATATTIITNLPNPSVIGQSVAVAYSVTSGGGTPTGNVTVSDGVNSCIGTVGAGSCSLTLTTVGSRTLTASYATDGNFAGSASVGASQTVNQAATTTAIVSHLPDPSTTSDLVTVVWSVSVTGPGAGTPTGTVTITTDGAETCSAAVAVGSCTLTLTTTGGRTLTATYGGDTRFVGSGSAATAHTVS